jgi:succinate dehydrogenase / fumarate reductase cytochrome b subunit
VFLSPATSLFGRYEFVIRRLHSLLGLIPIGGYMFIHLATNATILDGAETFQSRVDQINSLGPTTLLLVEWTFIFLPILFHGLVGLIIVSRGERNIVSYPYVQNFRYTLQRWTGVIAFAFIMWHVFQMHGWFRWEWWHTHVALPLGGAKFDPKHAASTAVATIQGSAVVRVAYVVGVLACVYHLANGVWTMGITWGVWTSPRAQRWANIPCTAFGIVLAIAGIAALWGMQTFPAARPASAVVAPRSAENSSFRSPGVCAWASQSRDGVYSLRH